MNHHQPAAPSPLAATIATAATTIAFHLTLTPLLESSARVAGADVGPVQSPFVDAVTWQKGRVTSVPVDVTTGVLIGVGSDVEVLVGGVVGASTAVSAHGGEDMPPQTMGMGVTVAHGGEVGRPVDTQSDSKGVVVATSQGGDVLPVGSHSPGGGTIV